jgi:hypothetical protein
MIDATYPDIFLDINFLSKTLFNIIFNINNKCYSPNKIDINNITLNDIKLQLINDKQKQIVNNIFSNKIKFLYRNKNKYIFKLQDNVYSSDIEIYIYNSEDDLNNLNSSENMNSLMTYILSELVIKNINRNILLNIACIDVNLKLLNELINNYPDLSDLKEINKHKTVRITISEHFFKLKNLDYVINKLTDNQIISVIKQVYYTLVQIQQVYPTFRHNMLNLTSIKLYYKKESTIIYVINNKKIKVNNYGVEVKITNFENSIICNVIDNIDIENNNKNVNYTYDIIYFLTDINKHIKNQNIYSEIINLIKLIKKNNKNILLSNIIMNNIFNNTQNGGKNNVKSRSITGFRYINNIKNKIDLPDSLSSDSFEHNNEVKNINTRNINSSHQSSIMMPNNMMANNMMPNNMMASNMMASNMVQSNLMQPNLMQANNNAMSIMYPKMMNNNLPMTSANLQTGGSGSNKRYINIRNINSSNFFF